METNHDLKHRKVPLPGGEEFGLSGSEVPFQVASKRPLKDRRWYTVFEFSAIVSALIGLGLSTFGVWTGIKEQRDAQELNLETLRQIEEARIDSAWESLSRRMPGNTGKRRALEHLFSNGISFNGIDLSCEWMGGISAGGGAEEPTCVRPTDLTELFSKVPRRAWNETTTDDPGVINLARVNFSQTFLGGAGLRGANLARASFKGAYLENTDFSYSNLDGANFTGAFVLGANFEGAHLSGTIFSSARELTQESLRDTWVILDLGVAVFPSDQALYADWYCRFTDRDAWSSSSHQRTSPGIDCKSLDEISRLERPGVFLGVE